MHKKKTYNSKTKNFIQGLRPFSNSIPHGLKKIFKKNGHNFSSIVNNWSKMIGSEIASNCHPSSVKFEKGSVNGVLLLNVIHGKEIEVEYSKHQIIERINSFFGYNCISQIKLKIIHEKKKLKKKIHQKIIGEEEINSKISSVQDKSLKKSLNNLINAFKEKHD
jgi:hypothetical protein|tara:strand:+ start:345 stop:836 length:492 start_codon:yes stop_codon:yes gene_type:complete